MLATAWINYKNTASYFQLSLSSNGITPLTARELEVLSLIGLGQSAREIAGELTISTNTARNHVRNVCGKLEARSKLEAVVIAQRRGLL